MSRLTDLLRRVEQQDPALAKALTSEVKALSSRRSFGLNFERHVPETVELPGRRVRRGDKVRFRAPRDETGSDLDARTWMVTRLEGRGAQRTAHLVEHRATDTPVKAERATGDLVVVAEFRDPIYPGLRSTGKVERGGDKPWHTVINGENYHVLEALLFAYEGQVDCIYIDPPYNTGSKDWKYNNDYVDSDDVYRHSKWLAMMERRLTLAKRLLNPADSVLIVTIDEREYLRLGLLLEQVFSGNTIQAVTAVISSKGVIRSKYFARVEESIFFVHVGEAAVIPWNQNMLDPFEGQMKVGEAVEWLGLRRREPSSTRASRPNQFYPIFVNVNDGSLHSIGDSIDSYADRNMVPVPENTVALWPLKPNGSEMVWGVTPETLRELHLNGFARVRNWKPTRKTAAVHYLPSGTVSRIKSGEIQTAGHEEDGAVQAYYLESGKAVVPKRVWNQPSHNAETFGTNLLSALIPSRRFPYPKSLHAVEDALRFFLSAKPSAIVLDFFSGSGTTAHALMRLNRQDGGRRRSIMVTNNEVSDEEARALRGQGHRPGDPEWEALGICEYITKPRIRAAITGQTPDGMSIPGDYKFTDEFPMADGFEENAEFFDLTYEDPERVRHDLAFAAIAPLLWMKAGSEGRRIETPTATFDIAATYGVLFNLDAAARFVQAVTGCERLRVAYIVTDDEKQYQLIASALPQGMQPVRLYEPYLGTFRVTGED